MIPYADFTFFGLLLYAVVPTLILGLLGRANWRWALLLTAVMLVIQYQARLKIGSHTHLREIWIVIAFGFWQWVAMRAYVAIGARGGPVFYGTMAACLLPLALVKVVPVLLPREQFGFLGISYITFRALDVIFCLRDNVIAAPRPFDFLGFSFFFPTISAGRSTVTAVLPETGKKSELAMNSSLIWTRQCTASFADSFTNLSSPR